MPSSIETEVLLKEYEICGTDADRLEKYIWTTGGLLITASVAGISLLGTSSPTPAKPHDYFIRILVSLLSIGFVWVWRIAALRWYAIQKIMYYRAKEIEITLGMYKERYLIQLR